MVRVQNLVRKITIGAIITAIFLPCFRIPIGLISVAIILFIGWMQNSLDEKYPYDISEYIYWEAERKPEEMANVLKDFAATCPYAENNCLKDKFCPDCPYGRNY